MTDMNTTNKKQAIIDIIKDDLFVAKRESECHGLIGAEEALRAQISRAMICSIELNNDEEKINEIYETIMSAWDEGERPYLRASRKILGEDVYEALQVAKNAARAAITLSNQRNMNKTRGKVYKEALAQVKEAHKALNKDLNY